MSGYYPIGRLAGWVCMCEGKGGLAAGWMAGSLTM